MATTFSRIADAARGLARLGQNWMGWWNNPEPAPAPVAPAKRGSPQLGEYSDLPAMVMSQWDVSTIKAALDSHELGQFNQSALLAEAMTRDESIHATLNTRVLAPLGCELDFELPKRANRTRAKQARRDIVDLWPEVMPQEIEATMRRWATVMGFSIAEQTYDTSGALWVPKLKVWHPQFTYFNMMTRRFVVLTGQGPVDVNPGDGKWIVYAPHGIYRGWMAGSVRAVAVPWIGRTLSFRDWLRHNEVHGMPLRKAITPAGSDPAATQAFWDSVVNMGNEPVIECPTGMGLDGKQGYDIALVEPQNHESYKAFLELRKDCSTTIAIEHLGQSMTTEGKSGGLSNGEAQSQVRQDYLEFDAVSWDTCMQQQLLRPFCRFNYGDESVAPLPVHDTAPPKDRKAEAESRSTAAGALKVLAELGAPVDVRRFCADADIPLLPVQEGDPPTRISAPITAVEAPSLTKNEARARRGLEPIADGDGPLVAPPAALAPPPAAMSLSARPRVPRKGAIAGQLFADDVVDAAKRRAVPIVKRDVAAVSKIVESATSYESLRTELTKHYADRDPSQLAEIVEHALLLAELAGRHSITEDA